MSDTKMTRRNFVAGASAMALALASNVAMADEPPAGGGEPPAGEGGPGPMGAPKDVPAAREAAKAEGRTFGYAGAGDWLGQPEDVKVDEEIDGFDVVVIGGGHAGTQAMLAAAEAGAKVALCEKSSYLMYIGEDVAAWNSEFVKGAGFPEYNLGEVVNEFTTRSGGRVSQEVVASYVNNSGETMDNMFDAMKTAVEDPERRALYERLVGELGLAGNEYVAGACYEQDIDESFYTYDPTRNGKIIIQAMFDVDKVKELTSGIDWAGLAVNPDCETTEEGYQAGYQALYDACQSFYDNGVQCLDHTGYPKNPGTKTWATTVQMMGHFHGREGHFGVAASSIIGNVQMACVAKAYDLGAQVFLGYKGYRVVQDEAGAVTGVIVYDADADRYVKFNCKAVISCAGGYVQNSDMCWALLNELQEKYERTGGLKEDFNGGFMACTGDGSGVKMLCWAGGFVDPSGSRGHMHLGGGPSGTWGCNCHLWLDDKMQRFCNEGNITAASDACYRKTGKTYGVIGGDYLKHIASCGLEHTGPNFGRPEYIMDMMYDIETGAVNSQIKVTGMTTAERMGGGIYKADSLENLAAGLGIEDVAGFVAAVEAYNELCYGCQDGTYTCDPQFGKNAEAMIPIEGPLYYGFTGSNGRSGGSPSMVTMSGVMADKNLNVEDLDGNPIPGLYCAGADLGGRYGTGYSTPAAGNSIGMALTNGRVAGKSAAAYLGF